MKKAYVLFDGLNSYDVFGMNLVSYSIGNPEPLTKYIDVPGRPGQLDATLALNGKVNYTKRAIEMEFRVVNNPYYDWHALMSELWKLLEGTEIKIVFSNDREWYYKGRFSVETSKTNEVTSTITISSKYVFPYKLDASGEHDYWDYDPTDFTVSWASDNTISSSGEITCIGYAYNGPVTIYASALMQVTFDGTTYQMAIGENTLYEIQFEEGENTLTFAGSGVVRIAYERGVL